MNTSNTNHLYLLIFLLSLFFFNPVHSQGIQMKNAFECQENRQSNPIQKVRFSVGAETATLNWRGEIWLLKYENTVLDKNADYVYQYRGHLFLLQVTSKYLNIIDTKTGNLIFSDSLARCTPVKYVTY